MSKSHSAKDSRRAEQDRQKRWGRQQKALHENQLQRDMDFYTERGMLAGTTHWQETAAQALWDSQAWRSEPEFADLAFDPFVCWTAVKQAGQEMEFDPAEHAALPEDEQDAEDFELQTLAIERVLTPLFKKNFYARLEQFRQRLRHEEQLERLAQASLVQYVLETAERQNESAWPECLLIFQLHSDAVDQYIRWQEAAHTALLAAFQTLGKTPEDVLTAAEQEQINVLLEETARATPGLIEFLDHAAEEAFDDALQALRDTVFFLNLFTPAEVDGFARQFMTALVAANPQQANPEDLTPDEVAAIDDTIFQAIVDYLNELDTPLRRAELYQQAATRLTEIAAQAEKPLEGQAELLLQLLDDDTQPLADNDFFQAAIMGETNYYFHLSDEASTGDDPDIDDLADDLA